MKKIKRPFLIFSCLWLVFIFFFGCVTRESFVQKRMKRVEKGLIRAVYLKGLNPEKLSIYDRMQFYRVPGVSLAVMDNFALEWAKGYGMRSIATVEAVDTKTIFQGGALSQVLAALVTLKLVDEKLISLDEDVNHYLKSWKIPSYSVNRGRPVTVRDLLTHSAGFYEIEFQGYQPNQPLPSLVDIILGRSPALNPRIYPVYQPGSQRVYSEAGMVILQLLLEDVSGQEFSQLAEEKILQPFQLKMTTLRSPLPASLADNVARGYDRQGQPLAEGWKIFPEKAAAGMWTNPSDLILLSLKLIQIARGEEPGLISPQLIREMFVPWHGLQAMAFLVEGEGDDLHFYLEGHNPGYSALMVVYPSRGQGVAVMANSDNSLYLNEEIVRAVASNYDWPHFQPQEKTPYRLPGEIYQEYVGRYEVNPNYYLDVQHQDYYLIVHPSGQIPTRFYAETKSTFFAIDPFSQIQFLRDEAGKVTGLVLRQKRIRVEAKKVS